ncbi:hypothetical protein BX600DRAFT_522931 [Xylariales sp. PMI_506]|nr:hypothetical protein BX600DRAFT_522931 [Xylariales sp. PMI_506]
MDLDLALVTKIRLQLQQQERPEEPLLSSEELQHYVNRGNARAPLGPNYALNTQVNIIDAQQRWIDFCTALGSPDWKASLESLGWEDKGLAGGFARYLLRREKSKVKALDSLRVYFRELFQLFNKYKNYRLDKEFRDYCLIVAKAEIAAKFGLRREPKKKKYLGPAAFTYLAYFRWVRDRTTFKIGLDRLDDSLIRILQIWTGCRKHKLVYTQTTSARKKIERFTEESGAYSKPDNGSDKYIQKRSKTYWVCKGKDERTETTLKVLCWEDIDLWILRNPENDGENKQIVPTWFPFVEKKLPILYPITHLYTKAKAERAFDAKFEDVGTWFNTNLNISAVKVDWKKEFLHKPVFRRTVESVEGPTKSDDPLTAKQYANNLTRLRKESGLPDNLCAYDFRRGNLEILDIRDQGARHAGKSIYQRSYHNPRMSVLPQKDAFLGRGSHSAYTDILGHIGMIVDENAPTEVTDEMKVVIEPDKDVCQLEQELAVLDQSLRGKYGRSSKAIGDDEKQHKQKQNELRAAKQKYTRQVLDIMRRCHFERRNNEEVESQLSGSRGPQQTQQAQQARQVRHQTLQKVIFSCPKRANLAEILSDLKEDLTEQELRQRKIAAINAWVDYAWKIEKQDKPSQKQKKKAASPNLTQIETLQAPGLLSHLSHGTHQ